MKTTNTKKTTKTKTSGTTKRSKGKAPSVQPPCEPPALSLLVDVASRLLEGNNYAGAVERAMGLLAECKRKLEEPDPAPAASPVDISKRDEDGHRLRGDDGKFLPIPLGDALKSLMPDGRSVKPYEREERFRLWLDDQYTAKEVEKLLTGYRKNGIPHQTYEAARVTFGKWWESRKHRQKVQNGKLSGEVRKAKKSKPKRGDKRSGPRLLGVKVPGTADAEKENKKSGLTQFPAV